LLTPILRMRYVAVVLFIGALSGSLWYSASSMKFELFPSSMADKILLLVELPTGTSLRATSDKMSEIDSIVGGLPRDELESFVTRIGTQEVWQASGFPPGENENWAYVVINLTPYSERTRVADEIVEDIRRKSDSLRGFERLTFAIEAGGPPVGRPITLRAVAADDSLRVRLADSIEVYLGTIKGVRDIARNDTPGKEQVEIKIDYDKLSRLGLTVADIAQNVRTAYDGEVVTSVRYGDEDVDFRVQLQKEAREKPEFLAELSIPNQQGRLIALKEVARLQLGPGPSNYYHIDEERAVTITADIIKGVITPLEATKSVQSHFDLDRDWPGARILVGGESEETEKSMDSLFRAFVIAIVAIYFLLILLFNSPSQPLTVLSIIPFGFIGVIVAFALHSEPIGFIAMLGMIGLIGVVINDALVLTVHVNNLMREGGDKTPLDSVAQGTTNRLRAVILTTLTTVVGLLPLAYGIGGADPYMGPMALALGYGLLFATPVTLVLMPCLYLIGHDIGKLFGRNK
ncbi:MAG: efflux RND transporter permease subunit, partial [Candidatus Zixiibacteriota bacterium]